MTSLAQAPVAPTRHTLILVGLLLAIALAGIAALQGSGQAGAAAGPATYLGLVAAELGLLYYVRVGLRAGGNSIVGLLSDAPLTRRRVIADIGLGLLLLLLLLGLEWLLDRVVGGGDQRLVSRLVLHRLGDLPLWLLLSATAGFVEELTFRGYLQRQFGAWLKSPWAGVVAQALLFGVTHGYQGPALVLRIAAIGLTFGIAARLRRGIVPGIVAHFALDLIGGVSALR